VSQLAGLLENAKFRWWIAGGYAIELAVGHPIREHGDIDVLVLRSDEGPVRSLLPNWEYWAADPPGHLRPWPLGEVLPDHVHDVWCRESAGTDWRFAIMIDDSDGDMWQSRRNRRVRRPIAALTATVATTIPFLAPEIQLYYKAKNTRPKDDIDFDAVLPAMRRDQRAWLAESISVAYGLDHPWLVRLSS